MKQSHCYVVSGWRLRPLVKTRPEGAVAFLAVFAAAGSECPEEEVAMQARPVLFSPIQRGFHRGQR